MPESPNVWHVYPVGGVSVLCERLVKTLDGCIELNTPVQQIMVDHGRVTGVRAGGREYAASAVVSTAPVHILARLVSDSEALRPLAAFRYRPMVFVNMRFEGRGLLPNTMLWTPQEGAPFFRLTETPLSMPWLAPAGKTMITADLGCSVGDETWRASDEALGQQCLDHLSWIPDARARYLGCRIMRSAIAYPVYLRCVRGESPALHAIDRRGRSRECGSERRVRAPAHGRRVLADTGRDATPAARARARRCLIGRHRFTFLMGTRVIHSRVGNSGTA